MQQPKANDTNTPQPQTALAPAPGSDFSPVAQSLRKGRWIVTQVYLFLVELFDFLRQFFSTYKQALVSLALILGGIIAFKIALSVIDALNDIPLVAPTLQLVGIGYSVWFVSRYLLKAPTRQELAEKIQQFLNHQELDNQEP